MYNTNIVRKQLEMFEKYCGGILGVAALHIETGQQVHYKNDQIFLMCSTYKLPIAIYLLHLNEESRINLDELYTLREVDLRPDFAFTLNDFDCRNGFPISIRNLLIMMLIESCNTSTDIILNKAGGPNAVTAYLKQIGIHGMTIDRYTLEIIAATDGVKKLPNNLECTLEQYKILSSSVLKEELEVAKAKFLNDLRDCSTPSAMTDLLTRFFKNELLTVDNTELILSIIRHNKLYPNRLMGLLPHKTPVAHKTGTATGYTNDIGIISLPHNCGHIAITAFIKASSKDKACNERILSEVGRTIYDYFLLRA